jgi:hypothetical protein
VYIRTLGLDESILSQHYTGAVEFGNFILGFLAPGSSFNAQFHHGRFRNGGVYFIRDWDCNYWYSDVCEMEKRRAQRFQAG